MGLWLKILSFFRFQLRCTFKDGVLFWAMVLGLGATIALSAPAADKEGAASVKSAAKATSATEPTEVKKDAAAAAPSSSAPSAPASEGSRKGDDKSEKAPAAKEATSRSPQAGTVVEMKTSEGVIKIELADKDAPISVKNFLAYVDEKFYDGLIFHRVIKDFMIQGGGYMIQGDKLTEKPTKAPIVNEAKNGLKNNRGTIAMARTQDPNSATAQFYINHVDNNNLDHPSFDGHGYAVFGKVVEGMDVVDKIANAKTGIRGGMQDVPLTDIKIISVTTVKPAGH